MGLYKVRINKKVRKKDLASIPKKDAQRIAARIKALGHDPYPVDAIRLKGRYEWRIRQGSYRVLYTVEEDIVTVFVVKVGHRRDIYR